jgi:hypothetical protein
VAMFEYVMVLASIIVGLGLTHLLQGVSHLVVSAGRTKSYWVHIVWVAYMFLTAVMWWWFEFRFRTVETWTFQLFLFVLGYAFIIYLMCAWLFPEEADEREGYKNYFYSRRRWFFALLAAYLLIDLVDTLLKGVNHFMSLGPEYLIATASFTILALIAALTKNERFHGAFAIVCFTYQFSWTFRYALTLS